jgi:hypothetical protein
MLSSMPFCICLRLFADLTALATPAAQ